MALKISASFMFLFFVFASVVQYNDPDWAFWMTLYGFSALFTLFEFKSMPRRHYFYLSLIGFSSVYLFGALLLDFMNRLDYELSEFYSEVGGLLIVILWFSFLGWRCWRSLKSTKPIGGNP